MNYAPDSTVVYVSLQGSSMLVAISVESGKILWKSHPGPAPAGVLWHNGRLLIGIMGSDYIAVVDPTNGVVERKVTTGRGAHVMFVPPDQKVIYVSNRVDGTVSVLDAKTRGMLRSFAVPRDPDDIDFGPDGKLWASERWGHSVAIVEPSNGQIETVPVGRSPHGVWLNTHLGLVTGR